MRLNNALFALSVLSFPAGATHSRLASLGVPSVLYINVHASFPRLSSSRTTPGWCRSRPSSGESSSSRHRSRRKLLINI